MSHDTIGPKEKALRDLRARKAAKPPTKADLRKSIAKIKPVTRRGKRGR